MYVCVSVAILMKKKFYQLFSKKKKIILPPLILNINNNKIITSVPVYEKCTSNNPPTTTTLPPKKCLCRPKIDLFLVCFPNYYFPQKNLDLIQIRATSGPFVLTSGKDKKWLICSVKKDIIIYLYMSWPYYLLHIIVTI